MDGSALVGTWSLLSFEIFAGVGTARYPYGRAPTGYITYTPDGFMCVAVMSSDRQSFAESEFAGVAGTQEEKARAFDGYLTYSGRYETAGDRVLHRIEVSLFPNWVGTVIERTVAFEGDKLILTGPAVRSGTVSQAVRVVWKRAGTA